MAKTSTQFRIMVGSYEHNLLCLSLVMQENVAPVFTPIFHFQAHALSIKSIDIGKRYLVTGSNDEHIRIYDLQKRKELGTLLSHQGTVTTLRFSREANSNDDGDDDTKTDTTLSGRWLLSGSDDGKILIWRSKDWELFGTLKGHQGKINDLDIHPSGRVAISVSSDKTIRLWNLMTAKKAGVLKMKGKDHLGQLGEFVRWTRSGKNFVVALLNQIFIYELDNEAHLVNKLKYSSTLMCMEIIVVDGTEYMVTGHGDGSIEFLDLSRVLDVDKTNPNIDPAFVLRGHLNRVKDISFFTNEADAHGVPYLVSVSSDGRIVVWDLRENVRDQVAVYDSGERLNCVATCGEGIEHADAIKRPHEDLESKTDVSESEHDTDGEELRKVFMSDNKKKRGKKNKKSKVSVSLE